MGARFEGNSAGSRPPWLCSACGACFDLTVRADVYEVKLDDEHLMSSLFTVAEKELARLALERTPGTELDVVIGGLGLGYTAQRSPAVQSGSGADRHRVLRCGHRLAPPRPLPQTAGLAADDRVRLVSADFFAAATGAAGFDPDQPGRTYDAVLLDIDHSPQHLLADHHAHFYSRDGLSAVSARLHPGGVFAMWSDDPPTTTSSHSWSRCSATSRPIRSGSTTR